MQLLLAVLVYGESFTGPRVTGFAMIWIALAIYAADSAWRFSKDPTRPLSHVCTNRR